MRMSESVENYLERIYMISMEQGCCRSIDVVNALGVSRPSVSYAMKMLRENGYIRMEEDNTIILTGEGSLIARRMYDRHTLLTAFLMRIGVSENAAPADACRIEHDISEESFQAIRIFMHREMNGEENHDAGSITDR